MIQSFLHNYKHNKTFRKECNIVITGGIIGSIMFYTLLFIGSVIIYITR